MARRTKAAEGARFTLWNALPIALTALASILAILAAGDPANAPTLRAWALIVAIALGALLLAKAIRDYRWGLSLERARYNAVEELHNSLGPALDMMTELATIDPAERSARHLQLEKIADQCCSALVAMTPGSAKVRAVVFEFLPDPDRFHPIGRFGRRDAPRTFLLSEPDGQEIMAYLKADPPNAGELYPDIQKNAPKHYEGNPERYRTFIRAPIWADGVVFGMVAVDAPKANSLTKGDVLLTELIASELAPAFAIAAD